ncbi:MAG: phthiocerol/phthiodiolone dimycocerosyl transferase family protein [Segniliparus sp.]|uniref:phthiocerol/phthiodiolone dimycocerosyl transferase family protein n=1 Tax=Segniliparus sp. TaxID=2804064 RepID=UPI003F333718
MSVKHRRLTFSEESFVRPATMETIGFGVALSGVLDVAVLTKAYAALRSEYPVLAARAEALEGGGFVFVTDEGGATDEQGAAASVLERQRQWDFDELAEPPLDGTKSLSLLQVDSDGDRHRVIFWLSHAIADAGNATFFLLRLWTLYTEAVQTGQIGDVVAHPLPSPPHEAMAERGFLPGDPPPYEERFKGIAWCGAMPSAAELAEADLRFALTGRVRLDRETSLGLQPAAKAAGASAHALVSAAIALAERGAFTGVARGDEIALGLLTPVDFKARLNPPLHVTEVTTLTGFSPVRVVVAADSDLVEIGREVSRQIKEDVGSGVAHRAAINPMPAWASVGFSAPILVSNIGAVPDLTLPAELVATDLRSNICKNFSGLPALLAAVPEGESLPFPEASMYLVMTFEDRISIEIRNMPGTISRQAQDGVLARISELLAGFVRDSR